MRNFYDKWQIKLWFSKKYFMINNTLSEENKTYFLLISL